jgi:hypothetical protein
LANSVGASPCTISTPGISKVAIVSGECTPGRVSSTIVLTLPSSILGNFHSPRHQLLDLPDW